MKQYRTITNDRLDAICSRYYGSTSTLVNVLNANPSLCEQPDLLPSGIIVNLPDLTETAGEPYQPWG